MARKGQIHVHKGLPNFASIRALIELIGSLPGTQIVSSSTSSLACVRDFLETDAKFSEMFEWGQVEVLPLSDMIRNFANVADIQTLPIANPEHRKKIAAIATKKLTPNSRFFGARHLPGFHEAFASFAREMKRYRVTEASLLNQSEQGAELASLLLHFEETLLRFRLGSITHRIEALLACKPIKAKATKRIIWVGETEWPKMQIELAKWLSETGVEMHLLVECHPSLPEIFPATEMLIKSLGNCEVSTLKGIESDFSGLFAVESSPASIELVEAADEFAECDWAVRQALLETRQNPTNRAVIFCRDLSSYGARLQAAATRLGTTIQLQKLEPLLTNPFARHVLAALDSCLASDVHPLADLCFSAYSGIVPEYQEIASNAVRDSMLSDEPFESVVELSRESNSKIPNWIGLLLEWRNKNRDKSMTLPDWERQFKQLTSMMPWLDEGMRDLRTQFRDLSAQDSMVRSLTHSQISIDVSHLFSFGEFVQHAKQTWRDSEYLVVSKGKIKVVSSASEIGTANVVFALGLRDGIFPKRRAEDPFLADEPRLTMTEFGLPTSYDKVDDDRREFYRLMVSAPRVVVSRPLTVDEKGSVESSFLPDLRRYASQCETRYVRVENLWPDDDSELLEIDQVVRDAWTETGEQTSELTNSFREAIENARSVYLDDNSVIAKIAQLPRPLSLYLLRALKRCPFQFVVHSKLGLAFRRKALHAGWLLRVVSNADIVSAVGKDAILESLVNSFEKELSKLRTEATADEVDLIRISAPKLLESFAAREADARLHWKLTPFGKATSLKEIGYRTNVKIGETAVELDDRIDFTYRYEGMIVPMRLGYVPSGDNADSDSKFDIGLILAFQPPQDPFKVAIVDSVENEKRQLVFRKPKDQTGIDFTTKGNTLFVDRAPSESPKDYIEPIVKEFKELILLALSGEMTPTPGRHCEQCELGGLCRRGEHLRRQDRAVEDPFET